MLRTKYREGEVNVSAGTYIHLWNFEKQKNARKFFLSLGLIQLPTENHRNKS
jgi:hypothetical protein